MPQLLRETKFVLFATKKWNMKKARYEYRPGYNHYVDGRCVAESRNMRDAMATVFNLPGLQEADVDDVSCLADGPRPHGVLRAFEAGFWPSEPSVEADPAVAAAWADVRQLHKAAVKALGEARAGEIVRRRADLENAGRYDVVGWKRRLETARQQLERAQWDARNRHHLTARHDGDAIPALKLQRIGRLLYGRQWQTDLARALSVNDRSVRRWARDGAPGRLRSELAALASDQIEKLTQLREWLQQADAAASAEDA